MRLQNIKKKLQNLDNLPYKLQWLCVILIIGIFGSFIATVYLCESQIFWIYDVFYWHVKLNNGVYQIKHYGFLSYLVSIIKEINVYEYNSSSLLLLIPFNFFSPFSRYSYILSSYLLYSTFLIASINYFCRRILNEKGFYFFLFVTFFVLTLPNFISVALIGYVPALLCASLSILAYTMYWNKPIEQRNIKEIFLIAVVVYSVFLLRRPMVYMIIGFCTSAFLFSFYNMVVTGFTKEKILKLVKNYVFFAGFIIFMALIFQHGLLLHIINTSYTNAYSYWQGVWQKHYDYFIEFNGFLIPILALISVTVALLYKKVLSIRNVQIPLFLLLNVFIIIILFMQIQIMGQQHNTMLLMPSFILLIFILLNNLKKIQKNNLIVPILMLILILIYSLNAVLSLYYYQLTNPTLKTFIKNEKFLSHRLIPLRELDYKQKKEFFDLFFNKIITKGAYYTIIKGNTSISAIHSYNFYTKEDKDFQYSIYLPDIDQRDLLNTKLMRIQYFIVNPNNELQARNPENKQQTVRITRESFVQKQNIGKAFTIVAQKKYPNGVTYIVYKKYRKITKEEIQEYLNEFYKYYPDWQGKDFTNIDKYMAEQDKYYGK
ncbi:hypothetical protein HAV_00939 [Candidatus Hepatincola sp. Av]